MKIWSDGLDDMGDRGKIKRCNDVINLCENILEENSLEDYHKKINQELGVLNQLSLDGCMNAYSEKRVYKAHKLLWIYFISFKNLIDANEKSQEKFPNNVDLELLETMFNERSYHPNGINFELQKYKSDVIDECYMVCPNNTRFDECSLLHKAGNHVVKGIIKKKTDSCPVKFYHIIPEN
ncbi:hypothetical protein RhiirA5_407770 [Rhizophagus irregularis]|uniref:Uncharacterized protein n=4 Tax=Rhizophagus irregularis TaxID=588596 RepID=A0A2N0Q9T4_9GLOM|nr:hypothetical protein GLOIN_2v1780075 [Rhizophagus irregularis DAOM 181602=DAOM 197198]PKC15812.1 hypothetical protein RhiirA5_407770 [Rhizophagus irregularis]POG66874.1 hypothetical protein GLOIN_2v1780075 [Rhizophagus irregularis DAOM 181602=DAOM 197198]|eukprot:XP_025173740.1 hypothetical protein GLOIN_2v1780075 [Rhizophagus irregularis DAOM 181602=DAOM 197198]